MTAGSWVMPSGTLSMLLDGAYHLNTGQLRVALLDSSSNIGSASTNWSGVTGELATNYGYSYGGKDLHLTLNGSTTVTVSGATDTVWQVVDGNIDAKWAVIYEVGGLVLCYCLLDSTGAVLAVPNGNNLTVKTATAILTFTTK